MNELKKKIISLLIILTIFIYPTINLVNALTEASEDSAGRLTPTDILTKLSECDIVDAEKNIEEAEKKLSETLEEDRIEDILDSIDKGELTYRNIFKNVCIAGDSLMNGLEAYDILNSNNLITQVSASLYHLSDNLSAIINMRPKILILHYGLNLIDNSPTQPARFISFYEKLINELKQALPECRIIVSSIFPVDTDKAAAKRFRRIGEYNNALEEMCKKTKVEYLDNSFVSAEYGDCYAYDGIHLNRHFYENGWLRHIVKEKEII